MAQAKVRPGLEGAFERIEETILPSLSMVLDTLLEAAALARPGHDADIYAAELRTIGCELEALTREVEALHDAVDQPVRSASAA
ncbi:MAG: hypothetical protein QOH04_3154 [Sphingomonadales bacterium]|nr:hypothetical protein [Sphingomonadales bacterium]